MRVTLSSEFTCINKNGNKLTQLMIAKGVRMQLETIEIHAEY